MTHYERTPQQMIAIWRTGCSNTIGRDPIECRECTDGLIRALDSRTKEDEALLRLFYESVVNESRQDCAGCGCIDLPRLRAWYKEHKPEDLLKLEDEVKEMNPRFYTHKPDCMIQRARAALGITYGP